MNLIQRRAHEVVQLRQSLKAEMKSQEDLVIIQHKVEEHLKVFNLNSQNYLD